MKWLNALAGVLILCSGTAEAATLTWNANTEADLAGYRVYQCSGPTCSKSTGSILTTLGKVTSFNIGTPVVTQSYFVTAYDSKNNESGSSNVVTYTASGSTPPPPAPPPIQTVQLTVVGNPSTGPWGVSATISDTRDVMAKVHLDGALYTTENLAPYSFPTDNGVSVTLAKFGTGSHKVEFIFYLQNTTTEIGRASITVQEGTTPSTPPPVKVVTLTVVGNPSTGPWGVAGEINDSRDVMAKIYLDGTYHHTENIWPYGFPSDNGITATKAEFGRGSHTVQFVFYLQNTTTEIGRASVTVNES
ncbi:MAG: hypothetical protein P0111_04315 [Nitrospira sp.]|nr:hypothetical protein [Nitrospira sp.]